MCFLSDWPVFSTGCWLLLGDIDQEEVYDATLKTSLGLLWSLIEVASSLHTSGNSPAARQQVRSRKS